LPSIGDVLEELERVVEERARSRPPGSYTAMLLEKGAGFVARKVGEEAVEVIVAALSESRERLAEETADLLYHLTVLLYLRGLSWGDVARVLEERRWSKGGSRRDNRAG